MCLRNNVIFIFFVGVAEIWNVHGQYYDESEPEDLTQDPLSKPVEQWPVITPRIPSVDDRPRTSRKTTLPKTEITTVEETTVTGPDPGYMNVSSTLMKDIKFTMSIEEKYEPAATTKDPRNWLQWLWGSIWEGTYDIFHNIMRIEADNDVLRGCYIISTTYMSAIDELRRYFQIRFLYVDNLEYEVGYVVYEIISKYQRMLEIFYLVENRFFFNDTQKQHGNGTENVAPNTYVLYMYTNVLEMSKAIIHLCNMLQEIETKYAGHQSIFDDYSNLSLVAYGGGGSGDSAVNAIREYERILKEKRKERKRQQRRNKKLGIITTPRRVKKRGRFPLEYGWSIENW